MAYSRPTKNEYKLVAVNSIDGENKIASKIITNLELNYLRDDAVLPSYVYNCNTGVNYLKDRCYSCDPGSVLIYSFISGGTGFTTDCLKVDMTINRDYFSLEEYKVFKNCYSDSNRCKKCNFEKFCSTCSLPFDLIDQKCVKSPEFCQSFDPTTLQCIDCKKEKPYLQEGNCIIQCEGKFTYQIRNNKNECTQSSAIDECPSGSVQYYDDTVGGTVCIKCQDSFVRRENICIKNCQYGEININGNCVICPSGTKATENNDCVSSCDSTKVNLNRSCVPQCQNNQISKNYKCIPQGKCGDYFTEFDFTCIPLYCDPSVDYFKPTGCGPSCEDYQIVEEKLRYCYNCSQGKIKKGNECVSDCGSGYYSDGKICQLCDSGCLTCNGPSNVECRSCKDTPPIKYLESSQCVDKCSENYFSGASNICLECLRPKFMIEGECVLCGEGTEYDRDKKKGENKN